MRFKYILFVFLFSSIWIFGVQAQVRPRVPQTGNPTGIPPQQNSERNLEESGESQGRKKLIDDSTKMVFGPKTSLYFLEKDVKKNRIRKIEGDTSLNNFHYFEPVAKSGWMYQDHGNVGSAAKPIFYQLPSMIGTTSGFEAYDPYYFGPDSMRYYDTKSPYTQMNAFFGGGNRNMLDLVFARNINPRWNMGFNFKTIRARKTLNPNARDDNLTEQNSYALHTNYKSEDGKYFLLGSFSRMRHVVNEQGGIISPDIDSTSLLFAYEDAKVWLRESQAIDLRQDYHLYHQYELVKGWQVYHIFDRRKQDVSFFSPLTSSDSSFFNVFSPERILDQDTTYNRNQFTDWRNELGFKGDIGPLYYNAFVKFRSGRLISPNFDKPGSFSEIFLGGALRGEISEKWRFEAEGEYSLPDAFRIKGTFVSPYLEATYTKAIYKPTAMQQFYVGNHHKWENNFDNIGVDQIQGVLKADFKSLSLRPNVTLNRINNYVFFNSEQKATQADGEAFMVIPGLKFSANLNKKLYLEADAYYTLITGEGKDNFRIPEVLVNSRLFYESPMFDENIFVQIGLEGRYRSDNLADFYNPAFQQYFIQNTFNVFAYPVIDFFFNARINRTRILLRMNHINMNMMSQPGYFVTPYYTGLRRALDIGISWPLFD